MVKYILVLNLDVKLKFVHVRNFDTCWSLNLKKMNGYKI